MIRMVNNWTEVYYKLSTLIGPHTVWLFCMVKSERPQEPSSIFPYAASSNILICYWWSFQ